MSERPPVLFFAQVALPEVGIPQLSIGCDRSLDEQPVVRLLGQGEAGEVTFDLTLPSLTPGELRAVRAAIRRTLSNGVTEGLRPELESAEAVIDDTLLVIQRRERLVKILGQLTEGEHLGLDDEGCTIVRCTCEHPANYEVVRWGQTIATCIDAVESVAVALNDHGLVRTDRVVGRVHIGDLTNE